MDFAEEYRSLLDAYEAAVASGNAEAIRAPTDGIQIGFRIS